MNDSGQTSDRPKSKAKKWALIVFIALVAIALGFPVVASKTSLRDTILQRILGDPTLRVSSSAANFGLFSPLSISDLSIQSSDGSFQASVKEFRAERSWLSLLMSSPELGKIEVEQPTIDLVVSNQADDRQPAATPVSFPTIDVALNQLSLRVRSEEKDKPLIDLESLDVNLRTVQRDKGTVLMVDPIAFADNKPITPELIDDGLKMLIPNLASEIGVKGTFSFELTKLEVALVDGLHTDDSTSQESIIEGVLTVHTLEAGLKNDVTRRLAMMASELLDLGGGPEALSLVHDAKVEFRLTDGAIEHQAMAWVLPDDDGVKIQTSGAVGFDHSLDLAVDLFLLGESNDESPLSKQLAASPLRLTVGGTIDQPQVDMSEDQPWVKQLREALQSRKLSRDEQDLVRRIGGALDDYLSDSIVKRIESAISNEATSEDQ